MKNIQLYTKKQMAELLDVKPRTIQYYTEQELIIPKENPTGKGTTRKYSEDNIFQFLLIKQLSDVGLDLKTIKQILDALKVKIISKVGGDEIVKLYDAHSEKGKLINSATDEKGHCTIKMKNSTVAIIINLSKIKAEVKKIMPKV